MKTLLLTLLMGTCAMAQENRGVHQATPTYFVSGPRVDDAAGLKRWLADQASGSLRLPFTLWRPPGDARPFGAIGVHEEAPDTRWRVDDSALGVALSQRLVQLCKQKERCLVWLTGSLGAVIDDQPSFKLESSPEPLEGPGPHHAQAGRKPECLAIHVMKKGHCARGPASCEKCKTAAAEPARPKLLDLCPWPADAARPVVELVRGGEKTYRVYEVLKSFDTAEEARAFAAQYGLEDVKLR